MKMESASHFEMLVDTIIHAQHHIPEDCNVHQHQCENVKSCICISSVCHLLINIEVFRN